MDLESGEPVIIETGKGKAVRLEVEEATVPATPGEPRKGLLPAIVGAASAVVLGAILWSVLAVFAGHGASPLAIVVALMVGMNVRLRGGGHTTPFRVVGVVGTLVAILVGGTLASTTVLTLAAGEGLGRVFSQLSNPVAMLANLGRAYKPIDLIAVAIGLYIAFRLSASKPPAVSAPRPSGRRRP